MQLFKTLIENILSDAVVEVCKFASVAKIMKFNLKFIIPLSKLWTHFANWIYDRMNRKNVLI